MAHGNGGSDPVPSTFHAARQDDASPKLVSPHWRLHPSAEVGGRAEIHPAQIRIL